MILGLLTNLFAESSLEKRRNEIYNLQDELEKEIEVLKKHEYVFNTKIQKKIERCEVYYKTYTDTANKIIEKVHDFYGDFNSVFLQEFYKLLRLSLTIKCSDDEKSLLYDNIKLLSSDIEAIEKVLDLYGYLDNTNYIYKWLINNHSYNDWLDKNVESKKFEKSIITMNLFLDEILSSLDDDVISNSERKAILTLKNRLRSSSKYKGIIKELRSTAKYYKTKKQSLFYEISEITNAMKESNENFDKLANEFYKSWESLVNEHNSISRGFNKAKELNLPIGYIYFQKNNATEELQAKIQTNYDIMNNNKIELENIKSEQKSEKSRLYNLDYDEDYTANRIKNNLSNLSNRFLSIKNQNDKLYEEIQQIKNEKKIVIDAFNELGNNYRDSVSPIFNFPREVKKNIPKNLYSYKMKKLFFSDDNNIKKPPNSDTRNKQENDKDVITKTIQNNKDNKQSEVINGLFKSIFQLIGGK